MYRKVNRMTQKLSPLSVSRNLYQVRLFPFLRDKRNLVHFLTYTTLWAKSVDIIFIILRSEKIRKKNIFKMSSAEVFT